MENKESYKYWELINKKLNGEATEAEIRELNTWIASSASNKKQAERVEMLSENLYDYNKVKNINTEKALQKIKTSKIKRINLNIKTLIRIAAMVIFTTGLGILASHTYNRTQNITITTGENQIISEILPDSTEVTLNQNSSFSYNKNYSIKNRQVQLNGEAFFKVSKNKKMPFIINAKNANIEVLGTSFNVNAADINNINVLVVEGVVKFTSAVNPDENSCILEKGQEAWLNVRNKEMVKSPLAGTNHIAWKTKKLNFNNVTINQALQEIGQAYQISFIPDKEVLNKKLTATYTQQPIDSIIEILKLTLNINITKIDEKNYKVTDN